MNAFEFIAGDAVPRYDSLLVVLNKDLEVDQVANLDIKWLVATRLVGPFGLVIGDWDDSGGLSMENVGPIYTEETAECRFGGEFNDGIDGAAEGVRIITVQV